MKKIVKNFADLKHDSPAYSEAQIIILPIPYERTTTYLKGTQQGPQAILNASPNLEFYDCELKTVPLDDIRIATLPPLLIDAPPELMVKEVEHAVAKILNDKKIPLILGGEHSITIGAFQAVKKYYPEISVMQMDAHADLREQYEGSRFNHACVMHHIYKKATTCQVGLRAIDKQEARLIENNDLSVFFARDIVDQTRWHEEVLSRLGENVYLTFDVDVFDPSLVPATGTPEPGGLQWYEVLKFLRKLIAAKNIIGIDVVELSPKEHNEASDFIIAKLIYKILGYMAYKNSFHNKKTPLQ